MRKIFLVYAGYLLLLIAMAGYYTAARISTANATQAQLASLAAELPVLVPRIKAGDRQAAQRCLALISVATEGLPSLRASDAERLAPQLDTIRARCKRFAESAGTSPPES